MTTTIALFRGINVGGKHILPMQDLKRILEELGCQDVQTYIQSGNVVLRSARPAGELAAAMGAVIEREHGFAPRVWLLSEDEFRTAAANNPYPTEVGKALHLFFLDAAPAAVDWRRIEALRAASESCELIEKVFYLHAPEGIGRSKLAAKLDQCLGTPLTGRNWNTVSKLLAMIR
jgi:uncharacterized protein (DUF1697 family)